MNIDEALVQRTEIAAGFEFHWVEHGAGLPLVMVHGGAGDYSSAAPQWAAFASSYRTISYSRRYSHPNQNPLTSKRHSALDEADDLACLLEAWNATPAILVASSYGALTSLALALKRPELIKAMVLVEPPMLAWADFSERGKALRDTFDAEVRRPARAAYLMGDRAKATTLLTAGIVGPQVLEGPGSPQRLAARLRNAYAMEVLSLSEDEFPMLDPAAVMRLDIPTLLVSGENTRPLFGELFALLSARMPHAEKRVVRHSGHTVTRDQPEAFNAAALDFLHRNGL